MLRARREARHGVSATEPRYLPEGGRSRYRDQSQGSPPERYGYYQLQEYNHPQLYGYPPEQYAQGGYHQQQQYNRPQQNRQHYRSPPPQWPQQSSHFTQIYDPPPQYGEQQPPALPNTESEARQSHAYPPIQPLELLPEPSSGPRPCVIPQISHKRFSGENMSPFVRVRVPELEGQISSHELIVFIDELNEAFLANPALQVANNAANIAGMAPSMIAKLVGVGVNVAAGVGSAVTTKVRKKKYLAEANKELFHPRGLHVHICKTDKMLEHVGLRGQENVFVRQRYKNAFESAQQVPVNGFMDSSRNNSHPIMQRMGSLGNRVMSLSFDNIEAATMPDGFWKKWGVKEANKAEQKQNERMMKDQARADRRSERRGGRGSSRRQERQEEKKAKETKKLLWVVVTSKEVSAEEDDDWESESESLEG